MPMTLIRISLGESSSGAGGQRDNYGSALAAVDRGAIDGRVEGAARYQLGLAAHCLFGLPAMHAPGAPIPVGQHGTVSVPCR